MTSAKFSDFFFISDFWLICSIYEKYAIRRLLLSMKSNCYQDNRF